MTAPTPDAVAQAREVLTTAEGKYAACVAADKGVWEAGLECSRAADALIAAVRAECAAKVRALGSVESDGTHGDFPDYLYRDEVLRALEAHP